MSNHKQKTAKCCGCEKRFEVVKPLVDRCALCQVKMDDGAVKATLEECGHGSLSTLIVFYKAHKKFWDKYRPLITAIQDAGGDIKIEPHRNLIMHDGSHRIRLRDYQRDALLDFAKKTKGESDD